jgi:hypothetical protein
MHQIYGHVVKPESPPSFPPDLCARLPESLRAFLSRGEKRIETEHDDWDAEIQQPAAYLAKSLPAGAVLIGSNGAGDHISVNKD